MGLAAGFALGFITAVAVGTYYTASTAHPAASLPFGSALSYAFHDVLVGIWILALLWLTASWWGLYLRYAWSNTYWPPAIDNIDGVLSKRHWRVRDRLMVGCARAPVGFLIISILASLLVFVVGLGIIR
jgi:hypothetical protein